MARRLRFTNSDFQSNDKIVTESTTKENDLDVLNISMEDLEIESRNNQIAEELDPMLLDGAKVAVESMLLTDKYIEGHLNRLYG